MGAVAMQLASGFCNTEAEAFRDAHLAASPALREDNNLTSGTPFVIYFGAYADCPHLMEPFILGTGIILGTGNKCCQLG